MPTSNEDADETTTATQSLNNDESLAPSDSNIRRQKPPLDIPTVTLNNGIAMPLLQLGTAQLVTTPGGNDPTLPPNFVGMLPERSYRQVQLALEQGVRAFDTAHIYRSPKALGAVLGSWWQHGRLENRSAVWLTTKIFHPDATALCFGSTHMPTLDQMAPAEVTTETQRQFEAALIELGVGYVDLMLLHWPSGHERGTSAENRARRRAAWRVLEDAQGKGWARAIGVSNFSVAHLEQLVEDGATIVPAVNQMEASITLQYPEILQYCIQHNIVPQAFSPLGRGIAVLPEAVSTVAAKYGKDVGQIALRYLYQLGYAITYLTNSEKRMVTNAEIFDFELSDDDMQVLNGLNRPDGGWGLPAPHVLE